MLSNKDIYDVDSCVENFCENLVDESCVDSVEESNNNISKICFSGDRLKGNNLDILEYVLSYEEIRKDFSVEDLEEIEGIINCDIEKYKYDYIVKSREVLVKEYGVSGDFIFIDLGESIIYNLNKICGNEEMEDFILFINGRYMLVNYDRFIGLYDMKNYDNENDFDMFMFVEYLGEYVGGRED